MPSVYIAAPLFSLAEISFNAGLRESLAPYLTVYLPQQNGGLVVELSKGATSVLEARRLVFQRDIAAIQSCDFVVIVLDGRVVDEGASFELGFAYALGKECVGLKTDSRQLLPSGDNPMISGALSQTFSSVDQLVEWARVRHDDLGRSGVSDRGAP